MDSQDAHAHLLGVPRVADLVRNAVLNRSEPRRVRVADPRQLDRRWPPGHNPQPVVGGVSCDGTPVNVRRGESYNTVTEAKTR